MRAKRACVAAVAVSLLAACAALPSRDLEWPGESPSGTLPAAPSETAFAPQNATDAERRDTLDRIWRTIASNFYDRSFNSVDLGLLKARAIAELAAVRNDAEYYDVLKKNVALLGDSHTGVMTPREAVEEHAFVASLIGIGYTIVDGHVVVLEVVPGFPAETGGVRRGFLLDAIDDTSLDAAFLADPPEESGDRGDRPPGVRADASPAPAAVETEHPRPLLARQLMAVQRLLTTAHDPSAHRLRFRRADDSVVTVDLEARVGDVPTIEHYERRPSGVGVLRLSRFDPTVVDALDADIATAARDADGLIVDLRGNGGGEIAFMRSFVEHFIERDEVLGTVDFRLGSLPFHKTIHGHPTAPRYDKPVVVLVDGATASASEWAARVLFDFAAAVPIGDATCGCVVGVMRDFDLPDGGALRVAELGVRGPSGDRLEGRPLLPTLRVEPTLDALRAGRDQEVELAEQAILATRSVTGPGATR